MLTGKAKASFEKWLHETELRSDSVETLTSHEIYYYSINWLDDIGLVSEIRTTYYDGYHFTWRLNISSPIRSECGFETREEALRDLITNCDKILNQKQLV
ncbi:UNVERIFIED_CONTAM: hypothetical protein POZ17_19795 [Ralstonia mannitolilytica]